MGADTPPNDPYLLDPTPTYIESRPNEPLYIDGGDPFDLSGGCTLDGVPVPCNFVASLANSDVAVRAPGQTTRYRDGHYEFFQAFADGRQGFLPLTARLGDGGWYDPVSRTEGSLRKSVNLPFSGVGTGFGIGLFGGGQQGGGQQNPDACGVLANEAGAMANAALATPRTVTGIDALRLARVAFDTQLSTLYVGQRLATMVNALDLAQNGANTSRAGARGLLGETGFKQEFTGERAGFNDQTHHFVTYFSAGLNGFSSAALIHRYIVEDNDPDRLLGDAAFDLGAAIRANPASLRTVRADILKKICDDRQR